MHGVPYFTTVQAARMAVGALEAIAEGRIEYRALQDLIAWRPD
jgi:carbamoyl-phosphate synthase large subunit